MNAFRQVDRVVEKTSDLSPLLAAFEDGNDSDKRAKLNSLIQSMIKTSHAQAMTLIDKVKEGSEEEFFVMLEENGVNEKALENFKSMELTEWKNFLHAKLDRGYHRRIKQINKSLDQKSVQELQDALVQEISTPESETCYDFVKLNLNQTDLIHSYTN